ncbi:SPOR domain-containing protein [Croceitalea rosinachiae]|uniref:SPOR domain-containing protein n=1 Tax=Croceitalea rosinachiae TaxID=3075596 RepID=A0ABU3A9R2_9FLAO|nr:SPOR domain-containing protein [Croceitalea sp. F388]MDT0605686.1 SPOR domain-containing protein [Croceitalea sp. F388]
MRTPIYIILLLFFVQIVKAQDGTINIKQDPKIDQLVEAYNTVNSKTEFYQIQVGFGSYQKAQNLKSKVEIDFPGWYSKIEFQEPTYRVRLGKFREKLEAERKFIEVRKKYPDAMLLKPENSTK